MLANAFESGLGQTVVYAGATLVASAITAGVVVFNRHRKSVKEKVDQIYVALVGEAPSVFNPTPTLGLVAKVEEYQKANVERKELGDELMTQFADHKRVVNALIVKVDNIQANVVALVADSKPNGGSTSRDQLNRIEDAVGSNPPEKE